MTGQAYLDEATQYLRAGDFTAAVAAYRAALALEPGRAAWHGALAACYLRMNATADAVAAYEAALELAPNEARFHAGLAQSVLRSEDFARACDAFAQAIRLKADVASWHAGLGACMMKLNDPAGARAAYRGALNLAPDNAAFHVAIARAYLADEDLAGAQEAFLSAIMLDPNALGAHLGLAGLAERRNDREAAIMHRRRAITLKPDQATWHVILARHLVQAGQSTEAVASLRAALALEPGNAAWNAMLNELQSWGEQDDWTARDVSAAYYDAIYASSKTYAMEAQDTVYAQVWNRIRELIFSAQAKTVLDVGCGPGQFASLLCQGTEIIYRGLDFSQVAIDKARARGLANAQFVCEDVRGPRALDGDRPDVIVCTEVLEHISDDLALLSRFREGSLCVCSVPSFYSFSHLRYFADSEQVRQRYLHFFESLTVEAFQLPGTASQIFLFYGRKMPRRQAVVQLADISGAN